ncbi:FAD-dependent oxidoreductase [Serinicoccus chungangensis]|uniref:FAD-dependent oxidoreductase n=1 Tax=Serinicoccus chungangensis TaxID=767452 RepID=UPI001F406729|nr:FAD-dependent oxidoreductase [Serinicoccus chungangensis]
MNRLLILGAGTAGTMAANHLAKVLDHDWSITVVDRDVDHHYQPGYLFVPFWMDPDRVLKDRRDFLPGRATFRQEAVRLVHPGRRQVELAGGDLLDYDWLVIASGSVPRPDLVPGMADGALWRDTVHEFYTHEGAVALRDALPASTPAGCSCTCAASASPPTSPWSGSTTSAGGWSPTTAASCPSTCW